MQNAILGIRTLNISQGNFSNFTHKGINALDLTGEDTGRDVWRAKTRYKCTQVSDYISTGFANTCYFSPCDEKGNLIEVNTPSGIKKLTIALTHDNVIRVKKGHIYEGDVFIYMEGTKGNATGNHIHAEACFDWVTHKVKKMGSAYYNGSTWVLPNSVPLHKALFLLNEYNIVKNDGGYDWKSVDSVEYEEVRKMNFIEGYQELRWKGHAIKVYLQKEGQKIGLLSAKQKGVEDYQARSPIEKIDDEHIHYCKINCNFFDMKNGQHYGVEQGFNSNLAPKQEDWYCLYIDRENNEPNYYLSSDYWFDKKDVVLACSPFAILRHKGKDLELTSKGANQSLTNKTNNTMLLYMGNGKYAFMVTDNQLNSYECREFAKTYGAVGVYELDGGGSAQMIVNGDKKQYTGRSIPNVLTFYKNANEPIKPNEKPSKPCKNCEVLQGKVNELENTINNLKDKLSKIDSILKE